ncbi:hypothetical protein N2152v2_010172 [Parachlorella kessleri]
MATSGSINGSVDTFDYISYVLNNEPLLSGPPEGCASNYTQGDVVVARTVEEVEEHLNKVDQLNQSLKGQLHNVTSGLETVIQTAHARHRPTPYGSSVMGSEALNLAPSSLDAQQQQQYYSEQVEDLPPSAQQSHSTAGGSSSQHIAAASCVVQHPGVLCCTKTTASANPTNMTCTVLLETTARQVGFSVDDGASAAMNMDDLTALAAQALVGAATDYCRGRLQASQAHVHVPERLQHHDEINRILAHGKIVSAERNRPSQFGHESYVLELADPHTGRRVRAVFKPRVPGDADGWHRAPIEWVAYELNLMLGMDYVPPVAYRRGGIEIDLGGEEGGVCHEEGAMMYWIENASQLKHYSFELWGMKSDVLLSDTRILDVLLHNSDRHHGHFLLGRHWAQGAWEGGCWCGDLRPALIDHAAGFRRDAHVTMQHENAFQTGPVRCVSAKTYLRLRFLDAATISQKFSDVLSEREMRELLHRRNYVLRYLDHLVEEQGYAATVVET